MRGIARIRLAGLQKLLEILAVTFRIRPIDLLLLCARFTVGTRRAREQDVDTTTHAEIAELLKENGGRQEARTPDLCVANAALSQLS